MRALFVTARPPWPPRRGDQARAAHWVRELGGRHELRLLALRPPGFVAPSLPENVGGSYVPLSRLAPLGALAAALRRPGQVALHVTPALRRAFEEELRRFRPDVVVPILSRVGWVIERPSEAPTVLDLVDSLALNMENRGRRQPLLGAFWRWEARRIAAWDRRLAARCAAATVVSERDRRSLLAGAPELGEKLHVVPFGLPVPAVAPPLPPGEVVLLSGNLGYFPTVDGALRFAAEVWPRVHERRARASWWLAGARPAPALAKLADLPGVRIHADPEDLGALRRRAAVSAVPLYAGSGTPIKVLEAMADGVPVVTTTAGRQGLDGVPEGAVAVADEPEDFAEEILRLLADRAAAGRQSRLAWEWVRERHALARVVEPFERLLLEASG